MKWVRFFRTIQAKLIIIYVLLILIAMQLIGVYFVSVMKNSLTSGFTRDLNSKGEMLSIYAVRYLTPKVDDQTSDALSIEGLNDLVRDLININDGEIQVLDASGKVLTTSLQAHQAYIGRKNTQTVVSRALQGIRDNEDEMIDENRVRKKIVAKPVMNGTKVVGAIYIVASMKELYDTIERINNIFVSGTLIALGLTALLGIILAHTITSPIKEITKHATDVAEGNFELRSPVMGNDEIGQLSEAFNYMTQRLHHALSLHEEEKEKLQSVLTNMSDGVLATDEQGHIIVMNRRAKEMLRVEERGATDQDITELLGISMQHINTLEQEARPSMLMKLGLDQEQEQEVILRVMFSTIHRRGEGVTGIIVVLQDVTEQEKLEQSRREFVANVSHELRTPLTTIKSYVEALDDGALEEPQLAGRFVGVIRNETERMIRLVTDLLHLSRLDSKQAILRKKPTNMVEMLEEVADRFSFQMKQRRIKPSIFIANGIEQVVLDRDQIDQVLDNLMSNAIKYTPDGGVIELEAHKAGADRIAISIKDTGMGIPKKDLDRIFDRFYRVDKARSRSMGGTGLGLSIAREIVKAHGGTINLESELGVGTKVTFTISTLDEGSEAS
ncbi:cell wall metabolism sensor histidine kinase WalK [Paenibacillus guangzhouensis]|uniref:cell wall metabolism sensor histidine kinase WalK n=1 Tax=Paenibacillus guangzhouensis TaxID=1473112 RepID=UPI00126731CB|nr:cell wall metabolism sensor histidine kinase WalK [Paenibacillus guangzhouensis]